MAKNKKIAYVCYDDKGKYASAIENEDQKLFAFLKAKGLNISFEVWSDTNANWRSFDTVLLKSVWDYIDYFEAFCQWMEQLKSCQLRVINPLEVIRWNCDKHYLLEVAASGLPVIPTQFIQRGSVPEWESYFSFFSTDKIVVKPTIGGGSKNTFALNRIQAQEKKTHLNSLVMEEAFMVQPFLPHIQQEGELSCLYFNGHFSHAVLKKAKPGDFRVQHYLGGSVHQIQPAKQVLKVAQKYVDHFAPNCLYARVDGIVTEEGFQLMELELIDPFLFLFTAPRSYDKYFEALTPMPS